MNVSANTWFVTFVCWGVVPGKGYNPHDPDYPDPGHTHCELVTDLVVAMIVGGIVLFIAGLMPCILWRARRPPGQPFLKYWFG